MSRLSWIILSTLLLSQSLEAYRALIIFPIPTRSHSILGDSLVKLIAEAGNEVTYITPIAQEQPQAKVKLIHVPTTKKLKGDVLDMTAYLDGNLYINDLTGFVLTLSEICLSTLQNETVQKLMNDPNEKFDVIIAEWLHIDVYAGLAAVFDCPLIWLTTIEHNWKIMRLIADMPNPAYNADITSKNQPPFSFLQRVEELASQISGIFVHYFYKSKLESALYEKVIVPCIRKRGKPVPNFEDLRFNASLVLGNSHVSSGGVASLPPTYKPIAGYHIPRNPKPLTGELKNLLDNADHGFIYFSLGSILKSRSLPDKLKRNLLKMFGGLKQKVLWKLEEDFKEDRPSNVHIVEWVPQQSVLAHPNCILFITHGGMLSMIEAIHFAKPLIGIPVYGDQFNNVARAVKKGFAKKVDLSYAMADEMQESIQEIFSNPSYAARAKELSFIYFHRPASPAAEVVHWVDHVVITRGALHLRSPALLLCWYEKMYLDLILVIIGVIILLKFLIRRICLMLFRKKQSKEKQN